MTTAKSTLTGAIEPIDRVRAYCEAVLTGVEVAGPHVHAACRRDLRDLESGAERGLYWDCAPASEYPVYSERSIGATRKWTAF